MAKDQLHLFDSIDPDEARGADLVSLLSQDLDFHDQQSGYASHDFHPFPAKFPPQLPRTFITALTEPGDTVLDPMMGSGTTILEAFLAGRRGIGFDIDPLALKISKVKVTPLNLKRVIQTGHTILEQATLAVTERQSELKQRLDRRWDCETRRETRRFIDYWFAPETQLELLALLTEIDGITDTAIKAFFELVFSGTIITKSGGVSLALDLAHTRPHRARMVVSKTGQVLSENNLSHTPPSGNRFLTKTLRSAISEFEKRFKQNLGGLLKLEREAFQPSVVYGNAQKLPLDDTCIDLIVTSPPYASNAIDYMRAHKFSLVWMAYPIDDLGQKRKKYIGGEAVTGVALEELPDGAAKVVSDIARRDKKKGRTLHRYYSEMTRTLGEMFRVLKPGKGAIVVVGSSIMRGRDTETPTCLAEIGRALGFEVPEIGVRRLDRNRRMMPAGSKLDLNSQIQQRMHEEYVIGFCKPEV